ncbi:hypothetical protein [Kribbella endophytica]
MLKIKRGAAAVLTVPLLAGGFVVVSTQTAEAACNRPATQNLSPAAGRVKSSSPLRVGPSEGCGVVRTIGTGTDLFYHCWVENSAGHKWTYVRVANTNVEGWMYNGNLNDGGSVHPDNRCRA